jgi:hypothetical protein
VAGSSILVRHVGAMGPASTLPRVSVPRQLPASVPAASGYTPAHANHASNLRQYQARAYASQHGHVGSIQAQLAVLAPGKSRRTLLVVCLIFCHYAFFL